MSAPFIGQIAIFGFQFAPRGWAFCHGQLMAISQNVRLFEILRTTYGGNGTSTFALPNLQGIPLGAGQEPGRSDYQLGQAGGEATVTLTPQQMPSHSHAFNAVTDQASSASPQGHQLAKAWKAQAKTDSVASFYSDNPGNAKTALAPNAIGPSGSSHPHNNMQPYLTLNFCIALQGVVPSPNGAPAAVRRPYLGEISICAFGNPPPGWALCEGQMLPVISNQPLFSLIFTAYGGDGERHFGLPDLRGSVPLNLVPGPNSSLGSRGGEETHALTAAEMPVHSHALMADATSTSVGNTPSPETVPGMSLGKVVPGNTPFTADLYNTAAADAKLAGASLGNSGGGQRHSNMMPSLALSFCINVDPHSPYPSRP
jgi:microcystin-dependent protein